VFAQTFVDNNLSPVNFRCCFALVIALIIFYSNSGVSTLSVQLFFAWRLWGVSQRRNWLMVGFIVVMALTQSCKQFSANSYSCNELTRPPGVYLYCAVYWTMHRKMSDIVIGCVLPYTD
jgi:hypothetical protein